MKPYFSHDEGARNDPKLIRVLMRLGQAGKGVYWDLVEMLHEQGGYLPLGDLESMAFGLRTDLALLTSLLNDFELFSRDAEQFWSETALARLQMRNAKAEARAAAGAKGGKAKAEREAAAKALLEQQASIASETPSNATALPAETLASKVKEIKEKESKEEPLPSVEDAASAAAPVEEESQPVELPFESPTPGLRTPGGPADVATRKPAKTQRTAAYRDFAEPWPPALRVPWAGPEFHAAWGRWASYLANEAGKRHGGAISEQADLDQLQTKAGAGGLARALQIIDESIARSWKALIDNQPKQQPHSTYNPQAHAVYPRNTSPAARAQYVPDVDSYGSL